MLYKDFKGKKLSALGLGCMRLPVLNDENAAIDEAATAEMVDYAINHGINYFDTAWGYHMGNSEKVMGKLLAAYPRESFFLASKFPGYEPSNLDKVAEIFEEQLSRCGVEYFDFYMLHNVNEANIDDYLNPKYGIVSYLQEQKAQGRIRHLGFSAHGDMTVMRRFLAAYGSDMEFCQLQINWLDWDFQNAREKVALVQEYDIAVWVMEPLRGGRLAKLPEEYAARLQALRPEFSVPEWSFRYLQSLGCVVMTLSGMSDMQQLQENIATYAEEKLLTDAELAVLYELAAEMTAKKTLPCTACRYCLEYCPQGLNIPRLIELYNEHLFSGGGFMAPMVLSSFEDSQKPSACIGCQSCENVCPQQIKIADAFADFVEKLNQEQ